MIVLALIGFLALYFLHGIREHARAGVAATAAVAYELKRANDMRENEIRRGEHRAAHERGRKG